MSPGKTDQNLIRTCGRKLCEAFSTDRGGRRYPGTPLCCFTIVNREKIKLTIRGSGSKLLQKNGLQLREGIGVKKLAVEIISGRRLNRRDDLAVFLTADLEELRAGADQIRQALCGDRADLCTIINGRSGRCSEDCKFCAQSCHYGTQVEEYTVEILKVYDDSRDTRDLMLRVTDPRLLEQTGGIVQGMSGSPILQDGKLVGAVTHVLVDHADRGYGILAQNMLDQAQQAQTT